MAKSKENTVQITVHLPAALVGQLNLLLYDPLTARLGYGRRSELIATLVREWIAKKRGEQAPKEEANKLEELLNG